jgi:signal transduction histidine kinase
LTLRRLQKKLEKEISEREKVEHQLRQFAKELEIRNEELDAFGHTVAHNLKNPLNALTGISHLLALDYATMSREDIKKYLDIINRSGRKATNIVQELLTLASVRQQEIESVPITDMTSIVLEAQQRISNIIPESNAEIHLPDSWPIAEGHAPWVEEIWVNYLSNGIKYGGSPPILKLGADHTNNGQVKFWVSDNGAGLTKAEQDLLFTPFTQLSKLKVQGHGLGLSIVRRIVEKLGGSAGVESDGTPGQGSTFSFTLPLPEN